MYLYHVIFGFLSLCNCIYNGKVGKNAGNSGVVCHVASTYPNADSTTPPPLDTWLRYCFPGFEPAVIQLSSPSHLFSASTSDCVYLN